ncbi:hypothetical protein J0B02_08215 [Enterobacteriaceae bacterium YMB-R22]|jgi:hypothetical protein|nr:hypothetical protein [Tenebrionicola larvae]
MGWSLLSAAVLKPLASAKPNALRLKRQETIGGFSAAGSKEGKATFSLFAANPPPCEEETEISL